MAAAQATVHVIVVADDAVEAGMLALDLVQAGFDAHAASGEDAALSQLEDLQRRQPDLVPGVVTAYQDLRRTSVLSRRIISSGQRCRFVAIVRDHERSEARSEAQLLDWCGVLPRPADAEQLGALLRPAASAASATTAASSEEGDLAVHQAGEVLARLSQLVAEQPQRRDCVLQLAAGERHGQVAIVDGRIVHAQADLDTGRHALERLCCWQRGHWRVTWARYSGERTIRNGNNSLPAAREYARRVAVARESVPSRTSVCSVRWERVRPLPVVAEAMFHRIASGQVLEAALDGEGDDELEAFAALVSRFRRGAVTAQNGHEAPQRRVSARFVPPPNQAERTQTFGKKTGFPMVPREPVAAPTPVHREPTAHKTAAYPRADRAAAQAAADDALTRRIAPQEVPRDLPELPAQRNRQVTSNHAVLPAALPEYESEGLPPLDARNPSPPPELAPRNTGWFGLNIGPDKGGARPVQVAAPIAPVATTAPSDATVNVSELVSSLPRQQRKRQTTDVINQAYAAWTDDYQATDIAVEEASVVFRKSDLGKRKRTLPWLWIAALVVVAAVAAVVVTPATFGVGGSEPEPAEAPVMRTYRRAVELIDQGRRPEALALLSGVYADPVVPAEAELQLAVLEIEMERYELGRTHLENYVNDARAKHATRAKKLHAHVFGKRR